MNRLREGLRSLLMRERRLERFERQVAKDGVVSVDILLKKGSEYVVRGGVSKGGSFSKVFLTGPGSRTVTVHSDKGIHFTVVPDTDGMYQLRAEVEGASGKETPLTVNVTLYAACQSPAYIMQQSVIPAYIAAHPELKHRVAAEEDTVKVRMGDVYGQTRA